MSAIPVLVFVQSGRVVSMLAMQQIVEINTAKNNAFHIKSAGGGIAGGSLNSYQLSPKTDPAKHAARIALAMSRGESLAWMFDVGADVTPDSVDVLQTLNPSHLGL